MAVRDAFGTILTIAEARGRAVLAGVCDAAGDLAGVFVTIFAAGQVIIHGWTWHSIVVLAAVMITSFVGTMFWTRVGRKIKVSEPPSYLADVERGVTTSDGDW